MSNFLVKDGDKAEWGIPEGYPGKEELFNIEWDGNTEGLVASDNKTDEPIEFVKVSDLVPTYEEILGATIEIVQDSATYKADGGAPQQRKKMGEIKTTVTEDLIHKDTHSIAITQYIFIIKEDNLIIKIGDGSISFPKKGTYFAKFEGGYISKFSNKIITPMNAEFLPGVEVRQASILLITTDKPGYQNNRVSYKLTEDLTKGLQVGQTVGFEFTTIPSGTADGTGANIGKSYVANNPITFPATGTLKVNRKGMRYINFPDVNIPVIRDSKDNIMYTLVSLDIYSSYVAAFFDGYLPPSGNLSSNTLKINITIDNAKTVFALHSIRLLSSSEGSQLLFEITVDDSGTLSATEVTT